MGHFYDCQYCHHEVNAACANLGQAHTCGHFAKAPRPEFSEDRDQKRAAKVRRDTLERQLIAVEKELRGEAKRKVTEARLWLLEGDG